MFELKNEKIIMTRGDTGIINLKLTGPDGKPYEMSEAEYIIFSVKKNLKDDKTILRKKSSRASIIFEHEDTNNIEPGNYFYDIELNLAMNQVHTIGPNKFIVKYDVSR